MAAAVSVGSAVPSPSWAVLPPHRNNIKLMSWRYVRCQCEIQLLNAIKGKIRHGTPRSNSGMKQLICFATLEGKSNSEPNLDPLKLDRLDLIAEDDSPRSSSIHKAEGKSGFVSFHGLTSQSPSNIIGIDQSEETPKIAWYIGPTVLVSFLVFPSLYLRRILSAVFEDSLLTDFLILFFTEALFYIGVAIFVLVVNHVRRPLKHTAVKNSDSSKSQLGLRVSSVATLVLSVIIPLVTMGMVWPWTGPAASATLAPYLVGLVVQFAFEQYARVQNSPAWPVIPIIFQVYRLHQLNRAAQLVTALSFSVRGAETTSQTLAINSSLGTLMVVVQILGVICFWSLSSFLMRFVHSSQVNPQR